MATQVDICNLALRRIGANTITAIDESTKMAEHCNAFWSYALDEVLEAMPWNFSKMVRTLDHATGFGYHSESNDTKTITDISSATEGVVTTSAAHGFSTGHTVYIYDVVGTTELNELVFHITSVTTTTFKLTGIDTTAMTAYSSGGSCIRKEPDPKYANGYTYDLPADFLKALYLTGSINNEKQEFEILGASAATKRLLTTIDDAILTYISLDDTATQFKNRFISVLAYRLAADLAIPLGKKAALADKMWSLYEYQLGKRGADDAKSNHEVWDDNDPWLSAGGLS